MYKILHCNEYRKHHQGWKTAQRHGKFERRGGEYKDIPVPLFQNSMTKCSQNIERFLFFVKKDIKFFSEQNRRDN